jgi:4-amino-4-deoxy-L-arabinose transferase-like glycosyltransferase
MGIEPGSQPLPRAVYWLTALAFVVRVLVRLHSGAAAFWVNGYKFFFVMAQSIAEGKGIRLPWVPDGPLTAFRVPFYSIFLAGITFGHKAFWPILIAQSLLGAGIAFCAALLALQLFDSVLGPKAAIIAAGVTAVYPYYVIHDTALQESTLFAFFTLLAIMLILRTVRTGSAWLAVLCGLILGLDVLTRATIAPFALLVPFWFLWHKQLKSAVWCALLVALTVSPWLWRNYNLTGSVTLGTEGGRELWTGNNGFLFHYYPRQSSDISQREAMAAMSSQDKLWLQQNASNEVLVSRWYRQKALDYIRTHPWLTFTNGFRKIEAGFSILPSPRHGLLENLVYALSYGPVMLLGLWGMWLHRSHWREDSLIYALFGIFALVTAVFWAHTSHRVYLDVYWIVFGAGAVASWMTPRGRTGQTVAG